MLRPSRRQSVWLFLALLNTLHVCASETEKTEWSNKCPSVCTCKWVNGKKQAQCDNQNLAEIPMLNEEIQALLLDHNAIHVLRNDVFISQNIVNLQKLSLRNSSINLVEKNAFRKLGIVIEIDLNNNNIERLDPRTFNATEKLRVVSLNSNRIQKIEDYLFYGLRFLQKVELNDNQISTIGTNAFFNLPALTTLKLNGNRLKALESSVFENLPALYSLELKNNPWLCDCSMRNFVIWVKKKSMYTHPTQCSAPDYLENAAWNNISDNSFACQPKIVTLESKLDEDNERLYLSCKVKGDPKPETHITFITRPLDNDTGLLPNGERK